MVPDPTAQAVHATAAGISALIVSILGVEPQVIVWGMVGATIGASFAPPSSRLRAIAVFIAVSLACSALGKWGAVFAFEGSATARNGLACIMAVFFHPMTTIAVQRLPDLLDRISAWLPGGNKT